MAHIPLRWLPRLAASVAIGLVVGCLAACGREGTAVVVPPPAAPASAPSDSNAENPDRSRLVDLATIPFHKGWVGGRLVQVRSLPASINAYAELGRPDVWKIHKYLLSVPLLMEDPDVGSGGIRVVPHGAVAFPDESADHLVHTWTLRKDITWEDHRPVTAADYVRTLALMRTPGIRTNGDTSAWSAVDSMRALADDKLEVRWKAPSQRGVLAVGLEFPVLPAHAIPGDAAAFNKLTTHLSCGPYRVSKFEGGSLELVLRDEYQAAPFPIRPHYVHDVVFEPSRGPADFTRLLNGEVHLAGLSADRFAAVPSDVAFGRAAWRTHFHMATTYSLVAWNMLDPADPKHLLPHPILGDVRVRTALAHLFPLDAIARSTFHGLARPLCQPADPRDPGSDPSIAVRPFSPARAASLLDDAGWRVGPDGTREKDGRKLAFTISRQESDDPLFIVVPQTFQDEARKVGVKVDISVARFGALTAKASNHLLDAFIVIWDDAPVEPGLADAWHSRTAHVESSANYSGFADAEVDRLLDALAGTFDAARRIEIRRAIHKRIWDLAPAQFLFANATTLGISRQFANVRVHDLGIRYHDFVLRELFDKDPPPGWK